MKAFILFTTVLSCYLATQTVLAAPRPTDSAAPQKRGSNASSAEPEIPASIFVLPDQPKDGRDPFFPNSRRPYANTITHVSTNTPNVQPSKLILNGKSKNLVMVNGRTFSEGEEGDVSTDTGRRHIRCVKIKEDSVIVEILENGTAIDRQELRSRSL